MMDIFNSAPLRERSHGHRYYTSPIFHDVSLKDLLPFMQKPLGMHHIRSKLFSLPLSKIHALYNSCLVNHVTNPNSKEYKPVGIKKVEIDKRSVLKLSFAHKGLDGINLGNILHHKSVKSKIPPYFKDQSVSMISYAYTIPIASKTFNYKRVLHDLIIDDFKSKPPDCTCASSSFVYNPAGHAITGDLKIINNTSLRDVFDKGSKYREPKSINWKHNFKILMDSVEDYARQWTKREKRDLDTLSELVEECEVAYTDLNLKKTQWIYEYPLYSNL